MYLISRQLIRNKHREVAMYADPQYIRSREVKVRFNHQEAQLIDALVDYTGQQRAVLVRELVMEGLRQQQAAKALNDTDSAVGRP